MSGNPTLLNGPQILAREITVDRPTAAAIVQNAPITDVPIGVRVLAAQTQAELRRLTGAAAFPMLNANPATFLSAR